MTIRISISVLATLLLICGLASLSTAAGAHTGGSTPETVSAVRMMSTGPLSVVVYRIGDP